MGIISKFQKAIQNPKDAIAYSKYKMSCALGYLGFRRFVVLSRSRTGSNMLLSFLNSHPNVYAEGEIFGRLNGRNYTKMLAAAFGKQPRDIKARGFKIFYYHPIDDTKSNIWNDLVDMNNLHVVHLKRRNILRTLLSRKIAETNDVWLTADSGSKNSVSPKQVFFTVKELTEGFEQTRQWEKNGDDMFRDHNILSIYYEDLVCDANSNFNKLTDFLGVEYVQPQTNLKRQNPERICDLISNYEELRVAFAGTEWEAFFEESIAE